VPDKTVIFNGKRQLKHSPFRVRRSVALWFVAASVAAGFLLFFLLKTTTNMPTTTYEPPFVKTEDNQPTTPSDTAYYVPTPDENPIPQNEPKPVEFLVHTPKITPSSGKPTAEPAPEILPAEQEPEVVTFASEEIVRTLEPDVVVIKTISDSDPETEELLAFYQEQQQKKRPFLKILSWGVKQYNYITNNDITVMQVENLTTNETVYYLCRGE
jgi:hypothetical protein